MITCRSLVVALWLVLAPQVLAEPPAPGSTPTPRPMHANPAREKLKEAAEIHKDLEYAKAGDHSLKLDLFVPKNLTSPAPLVIWIHGGGWQAGSKDNCPATPFVTDGFAVASVEYRFTDVAPFPAQILDCKAAVRYLRANAKKYNLDPDRFGAWGASAGGHLVALLGTSGGVKELEGDLGNADQSSKVQAVCDWFGPADFLHMPNAEHAAGGAVVKLLGGKPSDKKDVATAASPTTYITADDPPFLIMHGDEDKLVALSQSVTLEESLKKAGVPVKLEVLKGEGHGFRTKEAVETVRTFFKERLKPVAPIGKAKPEAN